MKTDVKVTWNGQEVKVQAKKVTGKTGWELALIVEGQAKLLAPVNYGYLAASITSQEQARGTELGVPSPRPAPAGKNPGEPLGFRKITPPDRPQTWLVGTAVEYAPYIEFGTMRMDAQPFLRPALDMASGKVITLGMENGKTYFADYLRRPV